MSLAKRVFLISIHLWLACLFSVAQVNLKERSNTGSIRLYNPAQTEEVSTVEIPVGNIATPGLVNWQNMRLLYKGENLPFSIREGKAHWRAALTAPVQKPRAEDLLVFSIRVPSRQWAEVELVAGSSKQATALTRSGGKLVISYPDIRVVIDERSGLLSGLDAFGESLLAAPLSLRFFKVGEGVVTHKGGMGAGGNHRPVAIVTKAEDLEPAKVKHISWSSTQALTEVNFVLQSKNGPAIGLTYRVYPNHQLEILSDERPWQGTSPWLDAGLEFNLSLEGRKKVIPDLQTYFPMYGYKDYAASVSSIGTLHSGTKAMAFEIGEESINGRFWHRRLAIYSSDKESRQDNILDMLNNGLVVETSPLRSQRLSKNVQVLFADAIKETGELVTDNLRKEGIRARSGWQSDNNSGSVIQLNIVSDPPALGISGDGFRIQPLSRDRGIEILAGTTFGLFRGASRLSKLNGSGDSITVPLLSQNPVVDLRAGGFGGGNFEVDFPYGNDSEWEHAFRGMASSGMNYMTCLGMWDNWKMPVYYKYMPELQSDAPDDYDEVSGTKFSEIASQREHGLKLLNFLHARGIKVWLWFPIGAVPTTFAKEFPDATISAKTINSEGSKTPRFISPEYQQYLKAYFKELLEVYPVDGFILIRDDNGGVDTSPEFKKYIAESRTKNPVWEQCQTVYQLLRSMSFNGEVAVYPYGDLYEPKLDSLLPKDMMIVGHGSGMGALTRDFNTLGTMGDTWLDDIYAGFRVPASARMKRLLSDRGSYWIGGAYRGAELPWEAIGYFGWQPSASVNTFRYEFGVRTFGKENALDYVAFSNAYEHLWEIMELFMLPNKWVGLSDHERTNIVRESRRWLIDYHQQLNRLEEGAGQPAHKEWFSQVGLYGTYFNYQLRRLELLIKMESVTAANKQTVESGRPLPDSLRKELISMNDEVYALAHNYDRQAAQVPGGMMAAVRENKMTFPFKEWVFGYGGWLDGSEASKQFAGKLSVMPVSLTPGLPFELQLTLQNDGCMPWISGVGQEIELQGDTARFGLPARWDYEGAPMVFGDRRTIILRGVAPAQSGKTEIKINFLSPGRGRPVLFTKTVELKVP